MKRLIYISLVVFTFLICACHEDTSKCKNRALGNIDWEIDQNAYKSVSDEWLKIISPENVPVYGDMQLEKDPLKASFNNEGRLIKLSIVFHPFNINSDDSVRFYRTEKIKCNNKKIEHLINIVSTTYGAPKQLNFNSNDSNIYFRTASYTIAQWETEGTSIKLVADNVSDGKSCCFKLKLITKERCNINITS